MDKINIANTLSRDLEDLPGEIWLEIPGYNENYLISQYSRIKSVLKGKEVILKKTISSGKYKVMFFKRGRKRCENVGRLCKSIHDRMPELNEVISYKDGNRLNDLLSNLHWISKKDSVNDTLKALKQENRSINSGTRNGAAIIDSKKAEEIRVLKRSGRTYKQLSEKYKVSIPCIQKVIENRSWRSV